MLYAILCYDSQDSVGRWTPDEEAAVMSRLRAVQVTLTAQGKLGPVARLSPTTRAKTLRKSAGMAPGAFGPVAREPRTPTPPPPPEPRVLDGPFAETKEQLLGFYLVECASIEAALEIAQELGRANPSSGAYEVRPVMEFRPAGIPAA